ncbi:hypothetical protein QJS10_CPA07g00834 [Acorus calamus]|uniref:Uncharacterized protein n=1 Tax=Acorus calamus TaxID=4465 RepID=A0AAV9EE37_ACOCL|nr:hypothetical protein QJS10_CPA07g00834 [Acorus calamus]
MIFSSFRSWSSQCHRPGAGRGWRTTWMGCSLMSGRRRHLSSGRSLDCLRPRRRRRNVSRHCFGIIRWERLFQPLELFNPPFKKSKLNFFGWKNPASHRCLRRDSTCIEKRATTRDDAHQTSSSHLNQSLRRSSIVLGQTVIPTSLTSISPTMGPTQVMTGRERMTRRQEKLRYWRRRERSDDLRVLDEYLGVDGIDTGCDKKETNDVNDGTTAGGLRREDYCRRREEEEEGFLTGGSGVGSLFLKK